jgi:Cys-tRNA synthase (O-phospho-L-seryl-tRNA:Cys-tRNA synthase)
MQKIVRLFGEELQQDESRKLLFYPEHKHKKVVGMILSSNTSVALSFKGGAQQVFNQESLLQVAQVSPDKRIIQLNEELDGKAIKGVVTGMQNNTKASVYLIIEQ